MTATTCSCANPCLRFAKDLRARAGRVIGPRMTSRTAIALTHFAAAATMASLAGCHRDSVEMPPPPTLMPLDHRFTLTLGGQPVQARLAVFPHERQRG